MEDGKFTCELADVIHEEWKLIKLRRRVCQQGGVPPEPDCDSHLGGRESARPNDLTGLALSGGGIRSASLSLGLVQSLDALGVMRAFDYLSTVSGGGYLGGYLSSVASADYLASELQKQKSNDAAPEELEEQESRPAAANNVYPQLHEVTAGEKAGQSDRVLRFIYGGKYLYKPWQLANKYLVGLLFNAFAMGSCLIFACSLTALVFRSFDTQRVRNLFAPIGLSSDTDMLFMPFAILLLMWLLAWGFSYAKRKAEAPGRLAQFFLYLVIGAFLVGCTLILVNGQTSLNYAAQAIFGESKITHDGTVRSILLTIIVGGLIPFLRPRAIIQRGLHPKGPFDRLLFRFSCICLMVGLPLVVVGYFGMQNISQTSPSADFDFRPGEIYDWASFSKLVWSDDEQAVVESATEPWASLNQDLQDLKRERKLVREESSGFANNYPWYVWRWKNIWSDAPRYWHDNEDLQAAQKRICETVNKSILTSPHMCVALADPGVASEDSRRIENRTTGDPLDSVERKAPTEMGSRSLVAAIIKSKTPNKPDDNDRSALLLLDKQLRKKPSKHEDEANASATDDALEYVRQALLSYNDFSEDDIKELNLNLLLALRPECFRDLSTIHRDVVTAADQETRFKWVAFSFVCCIIGLAVNLNATSLHRFYRNRLDFAYLERKPDQEEFKLSELRTTSAGAPYHLINASLNRFDSRFGYLFEEFSRERRDIEPDRRSTVNFLFSRLYCGSSVTKYVKSSEFEQMMANPIHLSDAIAISGSAVEPLQFDFAPLAWMMTSLNLRLGQWLPNPNTQIRFPFKKYAASVLTVLLDAPRVVEKRKLCYVSDGGFSENLGILPLLRRRCKLIVALDAGHDPDLSFEDLTKTIRLARVREGIIIKKLVKHGEPEEELDTTALHRDADIKCHRHWMVALIRYPAVNDEPAEEALLVYIKPSFTGDEGADLLAYLAQHPEFPHDTTADQLYDESRVEAYRQLGSHIGSQIYKRLFASEKVPAIRRVGTFRLSLDLSAVRAAALADTWVDPPPMPKSLEQIATSLQGVTISRREEYSTEPLRTINEIVSMSTRMLDESNTREEIYSEISRVAEGVATQLASSNSEPNTKLIADHLKRLAESWEALSQSPASDQASREFNTLAGPVAK